MEFEIYIRRCPECFSVEILLRRRRISASLKKPLMPALLFGVTEFAHVQKLKETGGIPIVSGKKPPLRRKVVLYSFLTVT